MAEIVLTTLNARYAHAAFGLRYLLANLGPLQKHARILEFDINQRPLDVLEAILAENPRIVGLGVYIWNASQAAELVANLKRVQPDVIVVLGGPEVSYETDQQEIARDADYVITGEPDVAFASLCDKLLNGQRPTPKVIAAHPPDLASITLPYHLYDASDLRQRVVYVEASRGCPFGCEFCLSSLGAPPRNVPLDTFLAEMQKLLDRGARHFKFVDRTFNLNTNTAAAILEFFLKRYQPGLFLHFEIIPDRLPDVLREPIRRFPPGTLQFEVGVQTFNEEVAERIGRRQDNAKVEENLRFLRQQTGVHVHADLIVGLPGEDLNSFAAGFDRLIGLAPQEIQVGILKRLRGAPISRHSDQWQMIYSPHPPYEVLQTKVLDFATMQRMRRFARYWDLVGNSGNFTEAIKLLWRASSPFRSFLAWSDWLFTRMGRTHAIALRTLAERLFEYLCEMPEQDCRQVARVLWQNYQCGGRREMPQFLREHLPAEKPSRAERRSTLPRQGRHLA